MEMDKTGYPKTTLFSRAMELGPFGLFSKTGLFPMPSYWPNPELARLNDLIWALPVSDRNIVVMKWLYNASYTKIAQELDLTKGAAYKRLDKIEGQLQKNLNTTLT